MPTKITLVDVNGGYSISKINENFQKVEDELNNKVLYRANPGVEVNTMEHDLDMNGHDLINVRTLQVSTNLSIGGIDLQAEIAEAALHADNAAASAAAVEADRAEVAADKASVQATIDQAVADATALADADRVAAEAANAAAQAAKTTAETKAAEAAASAASLDASKIVYKDSATGVVLLVGGTTAQRPTLTGAQYGIRYNITNLGFEGWNGSEWTDVGGGAEGPAGNKMFYGSDQVLTTSHTLETGKNYMVPSFTIADGAVLTVPDGVVLTIV